MVYYDPPKRHMRERRPDDKAQITDLPDELLLEITDGLSTDNILELRLTCTALAPAALTAVQRQMKILYVHPSIPSLRAVSEICAHPFSQEVQEVVLLGSVPHYEIGTVMENDPKGMTVAKRFSPWPLLFPEPKTAKSVSSQEHHQKHTYNALIECICKLPNVKHLSYQVKIDKPGLNQTTQAAIDSFARKYIHNQTLSDRMTDMQLLLDLLTSPTLSDTITKFAIRTALPFAPVAFTDRLHHLKHLELGLNLQTVLDSSYWRQKARWQAACRDMLKNAPSLESLELVLIGTAKLKRPVDDVSSALEAVELTDRTWPQLKNLALRLLPDEWHACSPRRPSPQLFHDLSALWTFFRNHTTTLTKVHIENIVFITEARDTEDSLPSSGRSRDC